MPDMIDIKAPAPEQKGEPTAEVKTAEEAKPAEAQARAAKVSETSVGELFDGKDTKTEEVRMVPESALIEFKKENKQLWKELKETQKIVAEGATKSEVSSSLKAIAEKHSVSEDFLRELSATIKAEAESEIDERVNSKIKPIQEKENSARIDTIFNENFTKTLEAMPEFKDIANRDVIKSLTLDPANAKKTFAQIIEGAYGHLVKGKRTIDAATPGGGREPAAVDFNKAKRDSEYFKEVMADPSRRKEYNKGLEKRLRL